MSPFGKLSEVAQGPLERVAPFYLRRLAMAAPARPRAKRPRVAGSGTDAGGGQLWIPVPTPAAVQTDACATRADSIATAPTVAAIATNLIFVIFMIQTPSINLA